MLQTATIAREIDGVQTDVLIQAFADRILVLVTQLGKVGSLVRLVAAHLIVLRNSDIVADPGQYALHHASPPRAPTRP